MFYFKITDCYKFYRSQLNVVVLIISRLKRKFVFSILLARVKENNINALVKPHKTKTSLILNS